MTELTDDTYFPYAEKKNFENNNPFEGFYEGLRSQDDGPLLHKKDDGDLDEGLWFNSYTRPHYEMANSGPLEDILRRLNAKQNAENYVY